MVFQTELNGAILIQSDLGNIHAAHAFILIQVSTGSRLRSGGLSDKLLGRDFLHILVIALCAVPVGHQAFVGQNFLIGIGTDIGRCIEADQGIHAAIDLAAYGEIQADGIGVGLAVVLACLAKHHAAAQICQSGRCVTAAKLAGAPEAAVSTGIF